MTRPTIAIVATGTTMRHAPWKDTSIEWWALAQLVGQIPKCDRAFELHEEATLRQTGEWEALRRITVPLYMQIPHTDLPTSNRYPLDEVNLAFRPAWRDKVFAANSVSYMLALALLREPLPIEIHLYGVDMQQGTEYEHQLRSVEFFLGIAIGMGVRIVCPPTSELLKLRFLYAYQDRARAEALGDLTERLIYFKMQRDASSANEEADRAARLKYEVLVADLELQLKRARL